MNTTHIGVVKFYNVGLCYGFITETGTGQDFFCHNNTLIDHIKKGDCVNFELESDPRGLVATNVKINKTNPLMSRHDENKDRKE